MKTSDNGSKDNKNAAGINWADYFDALEHEAWLESRRENFPLSTKRSREDLKLKGGGIPAPETSSALNRN